MLGEPTRIVAQPCSSRARRRRSLGPLTRRRRRGHSTATSTGAASYVSHETFALAAAAPRPSPAPSSTHRPCTCVRRRVSRLCQPVFPEAQPRVSAADQPVGTRSHATAADPEVTIQSGRQMSRRATLGHLSSQQGIEMRAGPRAIGNQGPGEMVCSRVEPAFRAEGGG